MKWDEDTAKHYLERHGHSFKGKLLIAIDYNGLTSLSARDYLINHCGYMECG